MFQKYNLFEINVAHAPIYLQTKCTDSLFKIDLDFPLFLFFFTKFIYIAQIWTITHSLTSFHTELWTVWDRKLWRNEMKRRNIYKEIGHSSNSALHRQMSPDQLNYTDKERLGLRATLADHKSDRFKPAKHKT